MWKKARGWLQEKVSPLGLAPVPDAAGNNWVTLPGESERTVIIGGHLDSVPNGGWLDGTLGVLVALEALRRYGHGSKPPVTLRLVDWADEEGARFGRSLLGSSAAAGRLKVDEIRELRDAEGIRLEDALRDSGVMLDTMLNAREELKRIEAKQRCRLGRRLGTIFFRGHAAWIRSRCLPVVLDAVATPAADCRALMRSDAIVGQQVPSPR